MCLLIVLAGVRDDIPLVVAANRDELYERPADPMTVLRERSPRVVGGRDLQAGGTWLAVNEHGLLAGLTNRPTAAGPDPTKKSRGELPLLCAAQMTARDAVSLLTATVRPGDHNPAWLIVADRHDAFAVGVLADEETAAVQLVPGVHILENRPFGAASPKVDYVRSRLEGIDRCAPEELVARLRAVLADHHIPEGLSAAAEAGRADVPPEVGANCVHTERYGTLWSAVVTVPATGHPAITYAAGPPCTTPFRDVSWS